jgi:VWFA-related protein
MNDVVVHLGSKLCPVLAWEAANSGDPKLDLVIVIDDSLANSVATRWNELEKFLADLPTGARAAVAYANRASIQLAQQPTTDHALAAKSLRNPAGIQIQNASPYESLQALIRGWPARQGRRVIIFVSSGIDETMPGNGSIDDLPYVQNARNEAQRKGVVVYSIYAKPTMAASENAAVIQRAQDALGFLSIATGGKAFYQTGVDTPPSFQPYLQEIQQNLKQQYLLTFEVEPATKSEFEMLRISVKEKSIQIRCPASVYVSVAK